MRHTTSIIAVAVLFAGSICGQAGLQNQYRGQVDRIVQAALADSVALERTQYLTDRFGPRLSGSQNLEHAIDWILARMKEDGLDAVRGEPVMVPHWVRGQESLTLEAPRKQTLAMLGLGGSVGTSAEGITAELLVVHTFDELQQRAAEAKGRIVVYDAPFVSYSETVQYRSRGAIQAAPLGAVAVLVRSVTPHSLYTPHTGSVSYTDGVPRIPAASITVEDAAMFSRLQAAGVPLRVTLKMEAQTLPDVESRNVVAEIRGSERPDEIVVLGGHIDSWDVGTGAQDDAAACVASWQALNVIRRLGLRPRRTIRVVFWANEENGLRGARAYANTHADEIDRHVLAIETDAGIFEPKGFGFSGTPEARAVIKEITGMLREIGVDSLDNAGGGIDIGPLMRQGVPGLNLMVDGSRYFWYHHTAADTADKLDGREMSLATAALAALTFVVADMPERLPRQFIQASN